MPATYEPIATTTLTSTATTITFSSISASYTDLRLIIVVKPTASLRPLLQFNSDTGTNYSRTYISGDGATASSATSASNAQITFGTNSNAQICLYTADIFSYAGSTNKTILMTTAQDNNGTGYVFNGVGLWRSTAAINTITILTTGSVSLDIGTTATLYGIKAA